MTHYLRFVPAAMLVVGALVLMAKPEPVSMPLRADLATALPVTLLGRSSVDQEIDSVEVRVAGTTNHLMRVFGDTLNPAFSLYVGYHAAQDQSNQMHSPRNCLPGAGWQILTSGEIKAGAHVVNRYLIEYKGVKALVLYWYQGRGRVTADEFRVKMHLFADASKTGRSEEALVRLVIPMGKGDANGLTEAQAEAIGVQAAAELIPRMERVLPAPPAGNGATASLPSASEQVALAPVTR